MDPQQERELDDLIAGIDGDEASSASAAEPEADVRETAEPEDPSEDGTGDVDEESAEGGDEPEPEGEDDSYEVNPADLTPIERAAEGSVPQALLDELQALRAQQEQFNGYLSNAQQAQERAEFAAWMSSLQEMDPDDRKDAVATRIANDYVRLKQENDSLKQGIYQTQTKDAEAQAQEKVIGLLQHGARRVVQGNQVRFVASPKRALLEGEVQTIRIAALGGADAMTLERMADNFVAQRAAGDAQKRARKQQRDARDGAGRTLAGAGAAKPKQPEFNTADDILDFVFQE